MNALKRLLGRTFGGGARRKEAMEMLANNREAEASLWARTAREHPPGSDGRDEARQKSRKRTEQARSLRSGEASLLRSLGLGGEE